MMQVGRFWLKVKGALISIGFKIGCWRSDPLIGESKLHKSESNVMEHKTKRKGI